DEASIDVALSKDETVRVAERLGIRVPNGRLVTEAAASPVAASFPAVVKPVHSKVRIDGTLRTIEARICADEAARQAAFRDMLPHTPVVEQEYFAGRGVGVEALFEHGEPRWLFAHERLHEIPLTGGASSYRRAIEPPPAVRDAALALLRELRWHGVAMVEFKVSPDGRDYRLIEINPRLWGSLPLAVAAGVNFPLGLLRLATGQPVGPQPEPTRCRYMRHVSNDVRWFVQSWKRRHDPLLVKRLDAADFLGLLRPLWGAERWDLFRWNDRTLWWAATRDLFEGVVGRWERWRTRRAAGRASRANWSRLAADWRAGRIERVLVLCYGNICRSPVVGLMLADALPGVAVRSAGMHPKTGRTSPAAWAETVRETLSVDLAAHRSQQASEADMAWAQLVIVMDTENWGAVERQFPAHLPRVTLLSVMAEQGAGSEVPDPYNKPRPEMRAIAENIRLCVGRAIGAFPLRPGSPG
ncbi:MAG: ATP-grasp domain-containing protein, partial [Rhizobacter sp.]